MFTLVHPASSRLPVTPHPIACLVLLLLAGLLSGCGTTRIQDATEQLVLSSAVDNSIAAIDFRPLSGYSVYFDDTYIKTIKSNNFVNSEYVISSLRQQIIAAGCKLQEKAETADVIIEGRIGTMGADDHRVTYGIPENNVLGAAASMVAPLPMNNRSLPELAIARRDAREGAAKIAAFAYDRETREPLWQSGISKSIATSRNTWVMGIGPFQGGSIRDSSKAARNSAKSGAHFVENRQEVNSRPPVNYSAEVRFKDGKPVSGRYPSRRKPPEAPADESTATSKVADLPADEPFGLIEDNEGSPPPAPKQPPTIRR